MGLTFDPQVSAESPVVRGTWVTAAHVVSLVVDGWAWHDILRAHPELTEDDIRSCLAYTVAAEEGHPTGEFLTPPDGTVRVRIAVATNEYGSWDSAGWWGGADGELAGRAAGHMEGRCRVSWVEADVPLPERPEAVAGRVVQDRHAGGPDA